MKRFGIMFAMMMFGLGLHAQSPIRLRTVPSQPPDSLDLQYYGKKNFTRAALTVTGLNMGLWTYDRFIERGDFAYISLHSIKENFRHGFKWDNDKLGTNMFLHPYHGSLYYNAARSNGYNYWQSGLFALSGSAMWELFMENEYPSTNDIIATPIGGMTIGEVTYRASDIVLKDNTTGWERFGREFAAGLISPMREITRVINGDAWRVRSTSGRQFGIPNVALEISLGVRAIEFKGRLFDKGAGLTSELSIEYGDRFEVSSRAPYDYFTFKMVLNAQASQPVLGELNIMGRLIARELMEGKRRHLSIGMYQHFDFYDSDTISAMSAKTPYKLGVPASVGCGVMYRVEEKPRWAFDAYTHVNGIILGGILSDFYMVDDRNYNLASGFGAKSGFNIKVGRDRFSFSAAYEYYRLFSWKGYPYGTNLSQVDYRMLNAQGDQSAAMFGVLNLRSEYRLSRNFFITASFAHYHRSTRYRDYPGVKSTTYAAKLMLSYKL